MTVVLSLACGALAWVVWPGRMSNDTLAQLQSVRTGEYSDWHAGLLIVLWRPFWMLGVGPGWVTTAGIACFLFGLYGVCRLAFNRPLSVVLAMATTATPMVLGYVGYLGRDLWFLAFLLAATACIGWAQRARGAERIGAGAAVIVSTWLMMASRQNAIAPALVLLVGALLVWRRPSDRPRQRRSTAPGVPLHGSDAAVSSGWRPYAARLGMAVAALIVLVASQNLARMAFGVQRTHPEQAVFIYDLAALSSRQRTMLFDEVNFPSQDLAELDAKFEPLNVNPLLFGPGAPVPFPVDGPAYETLRRDWLREVALHPRGYLAIKWRMWIEQIGVTGPTQWVYHPVIDPNPWGYAPAHPGADAALNDYLLRFTANVQLTGGPLHRAWLYLLAVSAGCVYLRDRRAGRRVLGWSCVSLWAYQITIFLGAMGIGYRFELPVVVLGQVVAAAAIADAADGVRRAAARWRSRPLLLDQV